MPWNKLQIREGDHDHEALEDITLALHADESNLMSWVGAYRPADHDLLSRKFIRTIDEGKTHLSLLTLNSGLKIIEELCDEREIKNQYIRRGLALDKQP